MPRTLAAALHPFVRSSSRRRGESYLFNGRVSVTDSSPTGLRAVVRGTQAYTVTLTIDANRVVAACTCPYFEGSLDPCKHIWATILAADAELPLELPPSVSLDTNGGGQTHGQSNPSPTRARPRRRLPGGRSWRTSLLHLRSRFPRPHS